MDSHKSLQAFSYVPQQIPGVRKCNKFVWYDTELDNSWYRNHLYHMYGQLHPHDIDTEIRSQELLMILQDDFASLQDDHRQSQKNASFWKKTNDNWNMLKFMKQASDYSSTSKALSGLLPILMPSTLDSGLPLFFFGAGPSSTDAFVLPLSIVGDLACSGASPSSTVDFALPSSLVSYSGASSTSATLTVVSTTIQIVEWVGNGCLG
ncbi:hypothetical protein Tco_0109847 [Tanacetum coccineum]